MPKSRYPLDLRDVEFVVFKRQKSNGGQKANKTSTSIRATHLPTGVRVEASKERSQTANKKAAIEDLQAKLDKMLADKILENQRENYNNKSEVAFSHQIRTYRLCGNDQSITDHRTGASHPNTKNILDGNIDKFILAMLQG